MNTREALAYMHRENTRLREQVTELEAEVDRAYEALTRAHVCGHK